MSNDYFAFRRFTIRQAQCAMKVSTDACIQGAWTPVPEGPACVLDIGCGTGLLSLMLVQRNPQLLIDAVELEAACAGQAAANIAASPWPGQIRVIQADVRNYSAGGYDLVICNPPFFRNSLKGPDEARNRARHGLTLLPEELCEAICRNLKSSGSVCVLWPADVFSGWTERMREAGFFLRKQLAVRPAADKPVNRVVGIFSRQQDSSCADEELQIYREDRTYSGAFRALLAPYYLNV